MSRTKLTLRPPPAKLRSFTPPPADPQKIALSQLIGLRYISRQGRYTQQVYIEATSGEHTWVDVPLVPEVYG